MYLNAVAQTLMNLIFVDTQKCGIVSKGLPLYFVMEC